MARSGSIGVGLLVLAITACEKPKLPTPPAAEPIVAEAPPAEVIKPTPKIVKDDGPMPTAQTTIATAGDFKVTVGDFEEASAISLLFAPDEMTELPPERLALPHVHVTMARSLLSQKVIAAELERRNLRPSTPELHGYLREHPRLGRFGQLVDDPKALEAALGTLGLTTAQLLRVAWDELGNRMLAAAMVNDIPDDEIWETYRFQNTTRSAMIVASRNLPTSEEIDQWMVDHADEIDAKFQKDPAQYRIPKRVRLNIVKPEPGKNASDAELEEAAKLLRKGVQPATVAKELNLTFELDSQLVRGENAKAFGMNAGEVGWTGGGARGAYAWKVVGFQESKLPEMTRPLRREIASELLRTTAVAPSVAAKLDRAAKIVAQHKGTELTDALRKAIEAIDGLEIQVSTFPNNPRGPLPKHGLAEEVIETTYATKVGETTAPFLSRERAFVVRVLGATDADRAQFDAKIDENRKAFVAATEHLIVTRWVEQKLSDLGAHVDVTPLRIKYGVLQKE